MRGALSPRVRAEVTTSQRGGGYLLKSLLIVDDEPVIRDLVADLFEHSGFEVRCAHSAKEAYAALAATNGVAVLITEINLGPGAEGFALARAARERNQNVAVIYISGGMSPDSARAHGVSGSRFVQKPFTVDDLLDALEEQLGDAV